MQIKKRRKKHTGESFFLVTRRTHVGRNEKKEKKHLRRARKTREKERRITPDRERK